VISAVSKRPAIDVVKHINDQVAEVVARAPQSNWGLGTLNPLDPDHLAEGERCLGALGFKGLLITSSWHGRFIDDEAAFPFWEWAQARQVPIFIHPPRVPIGHDQQMDQYKLDELVGRPFDTAMALARMILSGLFDRYPRLRIVVAHMGGGLLPVMGRLDFGWRLGCDGMPEPAVIRCKQRPSEYLAKLCVDTMGFWAPHVREAVDVFGVDRVMFGTDYGPVPIDPKEHIDIVNELAISAADKDKILWRNAARFFNLDVAT
jgi:predicted TIM-barrel fold metal-dependent hydrolase